MKKIFAAVIALMAVLTVGALISVSALTVLGEDGLAIPATSGISQSLEAGKAGSVSLEQVKYDDVVYSSLTGYFVGEDRVAIDREFPIYINGGAGLRFLDEETWLISTEVDLLQSYDGLYLNDGYTYTGGMDQADAEEFILLALSNGLYMNAQHTVFTNRLGSMEIPANSILRLDQNALRWYVPSGESLIYRQEESVFDATITIGSHTYRYDDLLDALGLIRKAIEHKKKGQPTGDEEEDAANVLNGRESITKVQGGEILPGSGQDSELSHAVSSEDDSSSQSSGSGSGESSGQSGSGSKTSTAPGRSPTPSVSPASPRPAVTSTPKPGVTTAPTVAPTPTAVPDPTFTPVPTPTPDNSGVSSDGGSGSGGNLGGDISSSPDDISGGNGSGDSSDVGGDDDVSSGLPSGGGGDGDTPSSDVNDGDDTPSDGDNSGGDIGGDDDPGSQPDTSKPTNPGQNPGEGGGNSRPVPYQDPDVSFTNLKAWSYAVSGDLKIEDRSGAIQRGVKITVYRDVKGSGNPPIAGEDPGVTLYPADSYTGKTTLLRKSYLGDQTLALSTLPPDTDVYVQFSYRYTEEQLVEEENTVIYTRKNFNSPLYKIHTLPVEGNVQPINAEWVTDFAARDTAMQLSGMHLTNTSDYQTGLEGFDWENFKLNTLPYINRMKYTLTPVDENGKPCGDPVTITAGSSAMLRAQMEEGVIFTSSSPKLDSNTSYVYTAVAEDRYGNPIPLLIDGKESQSWSEKLYTRKASPTVTVEEVENVTDKLTVRITVSDPDNALAQDGGVLPLRLYAEGTDGKAASLYGKWVKHPNSQNNGKSFGSEDMYALDLEDPADGKSYELTLESLAFAQVYNLKVEGNYDPQPDAKDPPAVLPREEHAQLGNLRVYTASLSSGNVNFVSSVTNLLDTSADLNAIMTQRSTVEILPLVDEFRFHVVETESGKEIANVVLKMSDLDVSGEFAYDEVTTSVLLQDGGDTKPTVRLVGGKEQYVNENPWQALLISLLSDPDAEKAEYSSPMTLRVTLPKGTMQTSTKHTMSMESVVIKSGVEYQIPTTLSVTEFTTKKLQPEIKYDDLFIAADIMEFLGLHIYDPDGTILEGGLVYAYLYYGDIRLAAEKIYASPDDNVDPTKLRFEGLITGGQYTLKFVAKAFNDAEGFSEYKTDKELLTLNFTGGSALSGGLNLEALDYSSKDGERDLFLDLTGEEIAVLADEGVWTTRTDDAYMTELYPLHGETFLRVENYRLNNRSGKQNHVYAYFYSDEAGKKQMSVRTCYVLDGRSPLFTVPNGAVSVKFLVVDPAFLKADGLKIYSYRTPQEDLITGEGVNGAEVLEKQIADVTTGVLGPHASYDTLHMLPVHPGQMYVFSNDSHVSLWTADKAHVARYTAYGNSVFVVPKDVYYISAAYTTGAADSRFLHLVSDSEEEQGYTAEISVEVTDREAYLARSGDGTAHATLNVYNANTMTDPQYGEEPYLSMALELVERDGGVWTLKDKDTVQILRKLAPNQSWMVTLTAEYRGAQVELDTLSFQTDGPYFVIHNNAELLEVNRNPFANYLVVEDFEHYLSTNLAFYGVIDFQGHVVTRSASVANRFINVNYGTIKNMVYDYPAEPEYVINSGYNFMNQNAATGVLENVIIRTQGSVVRRYSDSPLLCYANYGTIRNFVVKLGGDLHLSGNISYLGGAVHYNFGLMENGYMYASGSYGVLSYPAKGYSGNINYGALVAEEYPNGVLRNVYTLFNSWYQDGTTNMAGVISINYGGFSSAYHVGEFYQYAGAGSVKNYTSPMLTNRYVRTQAYATDSSNVFYIGTGKYNKLQASQSSIVDTDINRLYDAGWQQSLLGSAFDAEGCVSMGFYPRLNLPRDMQKYQEYIFLPALTDQNAPKILSDQWAEGYDEPTSTSGFVRLRMQNDRNATIEEVHITGLTTSVLSQGYGEDGIYDVILSVSVDADEKVGTYLSHYTVDDIVYSSGGGRVTTQSGYVTQNIEFWKDVDTVDKWTKINEHMNWNYRITADISFRGVAPAYLSINGSTTNFTSGGTFTGKIDGMGHTLSEISLGNTSVPWVIYYVNGGEVRNLVIDQMMIQAGGSVRSAYAGFIRYTGGNAILDNIHIRNSSVAGVGYMGLLSGFATAYISNCSVADSTLSDIPSSYGIRAGGMVGYTTRREINRSYVRNVTISVTNSSLVEGIGGIAGYAHWTAVKDCYATGSITGSNTQYVGGITGYCQDYAPAQRTWNDVDIDVQGNYTGGIVGRCNSSMMTGNLTLGNILTTNASTTHRTFGVSNSTHMYRQQVFAYSGQVVNSMAKTEGDGARALLTGAQLTQRVTWVDTIGMGSLWDYGQLSKGMFPKVLDENGNEVWGQTDIPLPDATEYELQVSETRVDGEAPNQKFTMVARITHPGLDTTGMTQEELLKKFAVELEGMRIDDISLENGDASIVMEGQDGETRLQIVTSEYEKALDIYRLTVTCDDGRTLTTQVDYGISLYWDIPDRATWDSRMAEGHGQTGENFRITGMVDFSTTTTTYTKLKLGRLEGPEGATQESCKGTYGFARLEYAANNDGAPWIESVSNEVKGLSFENMVFRFEKTTDSSRGLNGPIITAKAVENCNFSNVTIFAGVNSLNRLGFVSTVLTTVDNITVDGMRLERSGSTNASGTYAGCLASTVGVGYGTINAANVTVSLPNSNWVGGLFGIVNNTTGEALVGSGDLSHFTVTGYNHVGGVVGRDYSKIEDMTLTDVNVTARGIRAGGYSAEMLGRGVISGITVTDGVVKSEYADGNKTVTSTDYNAGGVFGTVTNSYGSYLIENIEVRNVAVSGNYLVGGFVGYCYNRRLENVSVVDCTVTNTSVSNPLTVRDYSMGAGGLAGRMNNDASTTYHSNAVTVRNTTVSGRMNVGGLVGQSTTALTLRNSYVAPDVTVSAGIGGNAGGVAGSAVSFVLENIACGVDVSTQGAVAGGLIGLADMDANGNALTKNIVHSYYRGSVSAGQGYAGGVIGKLNSSSANLTAEDLNGVVVAANVSGGSGSKASLWLNDTSAYVTTSDGNVVVWSQGVVNGQTAQSIVAAANASETSGAVAIPPSGRLAEAQEFNTEQLYLDAGFFKAVSGEQGSGFDLGRLDGDGAGENKYMPFILFDPDGVPTGFNTDGSPKNNAETAAILRYTEDCGIPLPEPGPNPAELVIYASGADTVNIEQMNATEADSVMVNGTAFQFDENGVITLQYDFTTPLTVAGTAYTPVDLRRTVMAWDDLWYYIDGTNVVYGDKSAALGQVAGLTNAIHLWQGKALTADGKVYSLSGGSAVEEGAVSGVSQAAEVRPFWSYTRSSTYPVEVYHNFSLYAGVRVDHRIFDMDGSLYTVSPYQQKVYDGVLLSSVGGLDGDVRYFALLGEDGALTSYLAPMNSQKWKSDGIDHISNNLGYAAPIVVIRYANGSVAVINYNTGEPIVSNQAEGSFLDYAAGAISDLWSSWSGDTVPTDGSFQGSEWTGEQNSTPGQPEPGDGNGSGGSGNSSDGTGDWNGQGADPSSGAETEDGANSGLETGGEENGGIGVGENNTPAANGDSHANGEWLGGSEAGSSSGQEGGFHGGGENLESGTADPNGPGRSDPAESDESGGDSEGGQNGLAGGSGVISGSALGGGSAVNDGTEEISGGQSGQAAMQYVPGEGLYSADGQLMVQESGLKYAAGKGIYINGVLRYVEESGAGGGSGQGVSMISVEEQKERIMRELGATVAVYDPLIGGYEVADSGELLNKKKLTAAAENTGEEPEVGDQSLNGEDSFSVNHGLGRSLTDQERQGFLLLAVIGLSGAAVLALICFRVAKRKK